MAALARFAFACFGLLAWVACAPADDAQLTLTTDGTDKGVTRDLAVRPNTKQPFFIVLKNISEVGQTFTVEIEGPKGSGLQANKKIRLERNESKPVTFDPPPPPKKEVPPKTPAEAKKEADEALKAEPPTGVQLPPSATSGRLAFTFTIRVLNEGGKPALTDRQPSITILRPSSYLEEPEVTLGGDDRQRNLSAVMQSRARPAAKADEKAVQIDLVPPIEVDFAFPQQLALKATELRAGSYHRQIGRTGQKVDLLANNLPLTGARALVKFNLTADNYPRAFTYSVNALRAISVVPADNKLKPDRTPVVRLMPLDNTPKSKALSARVVSGAVENPRFPTLPTKNLRFRVEVDNEPTDAVLLLRVDRSGLHNFADPDEVMNLGMPKDERVWLDVAGPDGAVLLSNTVADHVATVDISALRGPHELQGVLRYKDPDSPEKTVDKPLSIYNLIVDETPPPADDIKVGPFPKRIERGRPLPVFISAIDPDTLIERVSVVVGKPGPDGKFPPDAVVTEAIQTTLGWVAQVPLPVPAPAPPPPPGAPVIKVPVPPVDLTVVAENEVGLTTAKVVRIELVEPRGASLVVTVERGGRPQPGAPVTLRDADGKEKGAGITGANGKIKFENLAPGIYKASAVKEDTSYGLAGFISAQIPDPPPPPTKPVEATLPLAKRR